MNFCRDAAFSISSAAGLGAELGCSGTEGDSANGVRRSLEFLSGNPDLELVILFGSLAAGTAGPESDVDLAVYPRKPLGPRDLQDLSDRIALATGRPVDLVDLSKADGILLRQILRHGQVLVARRPGIRGQLYERLLDWQEDFEPALDAFFEVRRRRFLESPRGS